MPNKGDQFTTTLQKPHLEWGNHRHTNTRKIIYGEGYLQISSTNAYKLKITNSKYLTQNAIYSVNSSDGFLKEEKILASGNQSNNKYAKQFAGYNNLKLLGSWYEHINAKPGDKVKVDFLSSTEILLTFNPSPIHISTPTKEAKEKGNE